MPPPTARRHRVCTLLLMMAGGVGSAAAQAIAEAPASPVAVIAELPPAGSWSLNWSPLSLHYSPSEEHKHSVAIGLRRAEGGPGFFGGAFFTNSFGQPSAYAHYGQRYVGGVPALPRLYVEWSAGLMYGYVRDRTDDVPLNVRGFAPLFLISSGWQLTPRSSVQLNLAGTAAVMLQFDHRLD
jgi:hypothetical protein